MKKLVSMLLVLTMVLALAGTAMAACKITKNTWVFFEKDANAYTSARASKKGNSVVQKGSHAWCDKVCGDYARVIVNVADNTKRWFKVSALKEYEEASEYTQTYIVWAKGGHGMSESVDSTKVSGLKGLYVKVTGHTNLRKDAGMECKSQGVVEKCTLLKCTGKVGYDNRYQGIYNWIQVNHKCKKLWVSSYFVKTNRMGYVKLYNSKGDLIRLMDIR